MAKPTVYVIIHYPSEARRHSEPWTEIARVGYAPASTTVAAEIARATDMPQGIAKSLVTVASMKLSTDRAAEAELGYRPIR